MVWRECWVAACPVGQMLTVGKSKPVTEPALGGTMEREATEHASTKSEMWWCQAGVPSHQPRGRQVLGLLGLQSDLACSAATRLCSSKPLSKKKHSTRSEFCQFKHWQRLQHFVLSAVLYTFPCAVVKRADSILQPVCMSVNGSTKAELKPAHTSSSLILA